MSIYRCASCGSPNVMTDTQNSGVKFDYVKGAIGTVVLGAGGAVAGIKNTTQTVYKCPDCGMTLSYCMPEELKLMIDVGVESANARNKLALHGVPMDWDALVKQYKNIESGYGDTEVRKKRQLAEERELEKQELINLIAEKIIKKIPEIKTEIELFAFHNTNEESRIAYQEHTKQSQIHWKEKYLPILEQKKTEYVEIENQISSERDARKEKIKKNAELENQHMDRDVDEKFAPLSKEYEELQVRLNTLGFFKFAEKKTIQERMDKIQLSLSRIEEEKQHNAHICKQTCERLSAKVHEEWRQKLRQVRLDIEEKYPIEESPAHKYNKGYFLREMMEKAKSGDAYDGWQSLAKIITYYTLNVMEELTGGLSIWACSYCVNTNIIAQRFDTHDSQAIMEIVLPEMCRAFNIDGREIYNYSKKKSKDDIAYEIENIIEGLYNLHDIIRKDDDSNYITNV